MTNRRFDSTQWCGNAPAIREQRTMSAEIDADDFRLSIRLMSVGPDGEKWLNEHASGWREHVSLLDVTQHKVITQTEQWTMSLDPISMIQNVRSMLAHALAQELLRTLEPIEARYYRNDEPIR